LNSSDPFHFKGEFFSGNRNQIFSRNAKTVETQWHAVRLSYAGMEQLNRARGLYQKRANCIE